MADANITITIPSAKVATAKAQFLRERPIPQIEDPDNAGQMIDEYSAIQWFKKYILARLKSECYQGKLKLERDVAAPDGDLFT